MKKIIISVTGFLFFALSVPTFAEDVKITTSYPSPYGVYQELSSSGDTKLATDTGRLVVGTTTPPSTSTAKLYVTGGPVEADFFRAFEPGGVYAFIKGGDPDWIADMGGWDAGAGAGAGAYAKTRLDGAPLLLQTLSLSNVGIGTATPSASAKLEVSSANQGFLPPRVAGTGSVTPVAGLMVYDTSTTPGTMKYWNGSQWQWAPVGGAGSPFSPNCTRTVPFVGGGSSWSGGPSSGASSSASASCPAGKFLLTGGARCIGTNGQGGVLKYSYPTFAGIAPTGWSASCWDNGYISGLSADTVSVELTLICCD